MLKIPTESVFIERIFTSNSDRLNPLFLEGLPNGDLRSTWRYLINIDDSTNPRAFLCALRQHDELIGWIHVTLSGDWSETVPYDQLMLQVGFSQIYIAKAYRKKGYARLLSDLAGKFLAEHIDLQAYFTESPKELSGDQLYEQTKEVFVQMTAVAVHPAGEKSVQIFKNGFVDQLELKCSNDEHFFQTDNNLDEIHTDYLTYPE